MKLAASIEHGPSQRLVHLPRSCTMIVFGNTEFVEMKQKKLMLLGHERDGMSGNFI